MTKSPSNAARPWRKLGAVHVERPGADWCVTHAALPVVERHDGGAWRMHLTVRDVRGRSHIAAGVLEEAGVAGAGVLRLLPAPVLAPGALGTFDDAGVTASCVVRTGGRRFLYYTGWALGASVPFYLFAGLAVSDGEAAPFERHAPVPVLDRNGIDPYLTASPWVLVEDGVWRMWYVSAVRWEMRPDGPRHHYHIRYAESADGMSWKRDGHVCLDFQSSTEYAFGRPCVVQTGGGYQMWFSYRGDAYRIGYAESLDGLHWTRRDDLAGIDVSTSGWDARMIEYPVVFDDGARECMLYNGDGYGRSGVGLAVRPR